MSAPNHSFCRAAVCGCIALGLWACSPPRVPPVTVSELMEDRVALDGILMKCNKGPEVDLAEADCRNARIAIERLSKGSEEAEAAKRAEEFEKRRDLLRLAQQRQRQQQEAATKVDPYNLPVIPVDPVPPKP